MARRDVLSVKCYPPPPHFRDPPIYRVIYESNLCRPGGKGRIAEAKRPLNHLCRALQNEDNFVREHFALPTKFGNHFCSEIKSLVQPATVGRYIS